MEPPNKEDEESFTGTGRTLNPDGTVTQNATGAPLSRSRVLSTQPPPPVPATAAELELEARAPPAETDYVPPPPPKPVRLPSSGPGIAPLLLFLLVVGAGAGGIYYYLHRDPPPTRSRIAVVVLITSEPAGATVTIDGSAMGVTPWATDNVWAPGDVQVSLTHPGYRPWTGVFQGARPVRLDAKLQRR